MDYIESIDKRISEAIINRPSSADDISTEWMFKSTCISKAIGMNDKKDQFLLSYVLGGMFVAVFREENKCNSQCIGGSEVLRDVLNYISQPPHD